ncbi:hypothetical protein KP509_02G076400 [Ceratopteris richardii]|uniref:FHA domain-containing protein n=1 Tax=Ceratopteris richardii TaxID=49495 RepID=A0A8T2VF55_CERRI|nr:hypothetical protein KP509_02G076400 [Ceratopteris richardii]
MEEQQQVSDQSNQVSRSPNNLSSGDSRPNREQVPALVSPASCSPHHVSSKESVHAAVPEELQAPVCSVPTGPGGEEVWGVLTAISDKAKARPQGPQILLYESEHVLGRHVKDPACQFDSINVSGRHCTIFRKNFKTYEKHVPGAVSVPTDRWLVYIKDSSSNGTFINCQKLNRNSREARLKDGDIISLVNPPEHENAFAFLYEEVKSNGTSHQQDESTVMTVKRKKDDEISHPVTISGNNKRFKGLGIGGPDGPVSLDDDLRNQLEAQMLTIRRLQVDARSATAYHDAEIKELREHLSAAFMGQIQDLRSEIEEKVKELETSSCLCAQQRSQLEDRDRSLAAAIQSRKDADEVIKSQRINIDELKEQLEDERNQRRSERERAEADLKSSIERVRLETAEELKRQSDSAAQQLREHLEMINKLQEVDRENHVLIEALHAKLDDTRENLVETERVRRALEIQLQEEESSLSVAKKRIADKDQEIMCVTKEMEEEKVAKEKAQSRLLTMEVEMETAARDLQMEQQRLQGARERIVLRETQLRAFHSTAEEIARLQQKQQDQLKEMMRTLEEEEEEGHFPHVSHVSGKPSSRDGDSEQMNTQTREEKDIQSGEGIGAMQEVAGHSIENQTENNEDQNEDIDDADSQTTAVHILQNHFALGDGDTQMDEENGGSESSSNGQLVKSVEEKVEGNELSVRIEMNAGDHTQIFENDSSTVRYHNETQVLDYRRDSASQNRVFAMNTQLVDTENRSFSARSLHETQLLTNMRDENLNTHCNEEAYQDTHLDVEAEHGGCQGDETLLLDGDAEKDREGNNLTHIVSQLKEIDADVAEQVEDGPPESKPFKFGASNNALKGWTSMASADLLTSEAIGSWAQSNPASGHCINGEWSQNQIRAEASMHDDEQELVCSQIERHRVRNEQRGRALNVLGSFVAWHHQDVNVVIGCSAPEPSSRSHGIPRVLENAPDSEEQTEEEADTEDGHEDESDSESGHNSKPVSQSVSVSVSVSAK